MLFALALGFQTKAQRF